MMRMTEGNLALAAPAGMAGSFLRLGERAAGVRFGGGGREPWQEEEEEKAGQHCCCLCWSADRLRLMAAGWR